MEGDGKKSWMKNCYLDSFSYRTEQSNGLRMERKKERLFRMKNRDCYLYTREMENYTFGELFFNLQWTVYVLPLARVYKTQER